MDGIMGDIFRELSGKTYSSFQDLEKGVLRAFNHHVADIPPQYSYRELIELGESRGWVTRTEGSFHVYVTEESAT